MSQIHQMEVTFAPAQDRLHFRVSTRSRLIEEYRFWLTRRYVRMLWNTILRMLRGDLEKKAGEGALEAGNASSEKAQNLAREHQAAIAKADFESVWEEAQVFPLGEDPVLVVRVGIKRGPKGGQVLCMHPRKGTGIEFHLSDRMLHSLCRLLASSSKKARWDLNLDFTQADELFKKRGLN
ncbi:MAG: hypothetical protein ACC661_05510 [Verrucomicrobiales bacterium]